MEEPAPKKPFTGYFSWDNFLGVQISPLVFDSPHSGRFLPKHFHYACKREELDSLQDPYVDYLLRRVHTVHAPLLTNHIHRSMVDMNRHEHEINPLDVKGIWAAPTKQGKYAKNGHGVVPLHLGGKHRITNIYNEATRPTPYDIKKRLIWFHRPYHSILKGLLDKAHKANGFSIHINMHSMRRQGPLSLNKQPRPDIVLGTLHGKASHPLLDKFMEDFFKKEDLSVVMDKPFSGGALIQATHAPHKARYSVQIEIARDLYMNAEHDKIAVKKCERMQGVMTRFAAELDRFSKEHAAELKKGYAPALINHAPQPK